jgi:hypothetical protein
MLAITASAFDPIAFVTQTRQFAMLVDDYAALDVDTTSAVAWAGQGFTPDEARPWIDHGFTPERAGHQLPPRKPLDLSMGRNWTSRVSGI